MSAPVTSLDDVQSLCVSAGLDPARYQEFPRTRRKTPRPAEPAPAVPEPAIEVGRETRVETGAPRLQAVEVPPLESEPENLPAVRETRTLKMYPLPRRTPKARPLTRGDRWQSLQSVLDEGFATENALTTQRPGGVLLFSSSGGVGATSILATLARILSAGTSPVGLVENSAYSLLPMHFGVRATRRGSSMFSVGTAANAGTVHLVIPPANRETSFTAASGLQLAGEAEEWIDEGLEMLRGDRAHTLVDVWPGMSAGLLGSLAERSACIVPILPDMRSTMRLRPTLDGFARLSEECGRELKPFFVLNKFDANVSLHVDIRRWLSDQLQDQLLPFALRRSDEVSEALAEGETVVDYAPKSGIVKDFHRMAEWLEDYWGEGQTFSQPRIAVAE